MREFASYFGEIIVITAVSGLLFTAAPEGNMKKYIKFVISVALVAALTVPLLSIAASLPKVLLSGSVPAEVGAAEGRAENILVDASKKELEDAIVSYVAEKYGLLRGQMRCDLVLDTSDISAIRIVKIRLIVPRGCDKEEIRRGLSEMFLYQSEIEIGEVT